MIGTYVIILKRELKRELAEHLSVFLQLLGPTTRTY